MAKLKRKAIDGTAWVAVLEKLKGPKCGGGCA